MLMPINLTLPHQKCSLLLVCSAGMGGGPVLMPIYLTLGAFTQQAAVALSNSTILAGSIANVLCNGRKRHPFKDRPLVRCSSKNSSSGGQ
jgi:uncharacterized membrane protein YfcA